MTNLRSKTENRTEEVYGFGFNLPQTLHGPADPPRGRVSSGLPNFPGEKKRRKRGKSTQKKSSTA